MNFRIFLGMTLLLAPAASAMNYSDFRRSDDIEDRRETDTYPDDPIDLIKKLAAPARAGQMPFLCPGLKDVAAEVAAIGDSLRQQPTIREIKVNFDNEEQANLAGAGSGDANSCAGAKQALESNVSQSQGAISKHQGRLRAMHGGLYEKARSVVSKIENKLAQPSLGDKINNSISKCPAYAKQVKEAVFNYAQEVSKLDSYFSAMSSRLADQKSRVDLVQCGTAMAPKPLKSQRK